ncbi:uL15 family ribosomal protein, partial [Mycobacterium tuberculosis]
MEGRKATIFTQRTHRPPRAREQVPVTFEGGQMPIHMRLPKLKGFRNRFR